MRLIKLITFQLKLYLKNNYFISLVLISTTTLLLYEYLASYPSKSYSGNEWLIAGVMGLWSSCTTSAGALGYQRFQGTLIHLLNSGISTIQVLISIISPAAIYGLIAFPLAAIESFILQIPINNVNYNTLIGIILFWLAATVLSYFISLLFILSKNSLEYEELILLPVLLLSGLLPLPKAIFAHIYPAQLLSPLTVPIKIIYGQHTTVLEIISYFLIILIFAYIGKHLTNVVIKRAIKEGRLAVF